MSVNTNLLVACEKLNEQNNDETWIQFFDAISAARAQAEDDAPVCDAAGQEEVHEGDQERTVETACRPARGG